MLLPRIAYSQPPAPPPVKSHKDYKKHLRLTSTIHSVAQAQPSGARSASSRRTVSPEARRYSMSSQPVAVRTCTSNISTSRDATALGGGPLPLFAGRLSSTGQSDASSSSLIGRSFGLLSTEVRRTIEDREENNDGGTRVLKQMLCVLLFLVVGSGLSKEIPTAAPSLAQDGPISPCLKRAAQHEALMSRTLLTVASASFFLGVFFCSFVVCCLWCISAKVEYSVEDGFVSSFDGSVMRQHLSRMKDFATARKPNRYARLDIHDDDEPTTERRKQTRVAQSMKKRKTNRDKKKKPSASLRRRDQEDETGLEMAGLNVASSSDRNDDDNDDDDDDDDVVEV